MSDSYDEKYKAKFDDLNDMINMYVKNRHISTEEIDHILNNGHKDISLCGLFKTGNIVMTQSINSWINDESESEHEKLYKHRFVNWCLLRHISGDWGTQCYEDFKENEFSLKYGERLMSVFEYHDIVTCDDYVIWIITERDRKTTTVLTPEDY